MSWRRETRPSLNSSNETKNSRSVAHSSYWSPQGEGGWGGGEREVEEGKRKLRRKRKEEGEEERSRGREEEGREARGEVERKGEGKRGKRRGRRL